MLAFSAQKHLHRMNEGTLATARVYLAIGKSTLGMLTFFRTKALMPQVDWSRFLGRKK